MYCRTVFDTLVYFVIVGKTVIAVGMTKQCTVVLQVIRLQTFTITEAVKVKLPPPNHESMSGSRCRPVLIT
jgi:hypothetical protein